MADLTTALFRVDPTAGLAEYVQAVKPYHTKILDILVEYVYTERINVEVIDRLQTRIGLARPNVTVKYHDPAGTPPYNLLVSDARSDVVYGCGYGYTWSEFGVTAPEANVQTVVISAAAGPCADDQTSQDPNNPIMGTLCLSNSFLVESTTSAAYTAVVSDLNRNQIIISRPYAVVSVDALTKTWVVSGNLTTGDNQLVAGMMCYITDNTGAGVNQAYTVDSVSFASGNTTVIVQESISLSATNTGKLSVPSSFDSIPYWSYGVKIKLESATALPEGLTSSGDYYFIPTAIPGIFNVATKRYPQIIADYVDLTTIGEGQLTVTRLEPFIPGQTIEINGSYLQRNDGEYIISNVIPEGSNYRLTVLQAVPFDTPAGRPTDGIASVSTGGFDMPEYCAVASASDVHADAFIHEKLEMVFTITFSEAATTTVNENQTDGYGDMAFGIGDSYGIYSRSLPPYTASSQGVNGVLLPTGFDIGFFDCGGMDETIEFAARNHGNTLYT